MAFDDQTRRRLFKTVTACRNLLTEAYARKVWRGRFVELVEVCSRCTAKAAKP